MADPQRRSLGIARQSHGIAQGPQPARRRLAGNGVEGIVERPDEPVRDARIVGDPGAEHGRVVARDVGDQERLDIGPGEESGQPPALDLRERDALAVQLLDVEPLGQRALEKRDQVGQAHAGRRNFK